jgi:hypothetical protein
MQARVAWPLLVGLGAGLAALGAGPTPADKQTFLGRKAIYLSFEIIETGMREFGANTPKDPSRTVRIASIEA